MIFKNLISSEKTLKIMQVEFESEFTAKITLRYETDWLYLNRTIHLKPEELNIWVQLREQTLTNPDENNNFWNDAFDLDWVLMKINNPFSTSKTIIRIPFRDCKEAFEKIIKKIKG